MKRLIEIPGHASVLHVADIANAGITSGEVATDLLGCVGRVIVGDDDLDILDGLREKRLDRDGSVRFAIEDGEPDADEGSGTATHDGDQEGIKPARSAISRAMANDDVAAGEGAFITWNWAPSVLIAKSSMKLPSRATA